MKIIIIIIKGNEEGGKKERKTRTWRENKRKNEQFIFPDGLRLVNRREEKKNCVSDV